MVMCLQNLNPCNLATQPTSDVMLVTFPSLACGKNIVGIGIDWWFLVNVAAFLSESSYEYAFLVALLKNCIVTKPQ